MAYFSGQVRTLTSIDEHDIAILVNRLQEDGSIWERWDKLKPNRFGVFDGCAQHIVFKYPVSLDDHRHSALFPLWRGWQPIIQPLIDRAVSSYGYECGSTSRIMLAKLRANSDIPMHIDASNSAKEPHKIHIPLITKKEIVMNFSGNNSQHLEVGKSYEVNNRIEHGVSNPTDLDRVHLVFDYFG